MKTMHRDPGSSGIDPSAVTRNRRRKIGALGLFLAPCLAISSPALAQSATAEVSPEAAHVVWKRRLGTAFEDIAFGVASDAGGNIIIAGSTDGPLAGPNRGPSDAWMAKYDAGGKLMWKRQFGTAADDVASGVATDGGGNVLIAGKTKGYLGGSYQDRSWLAKYDADGKLAWKRWLELHDAGGVAVDGSGNVFVSGTAGVVLKFDGDGQFLWRRRLGGWPGEIYTTHAVATDGSGNVVIAGRVGYELRETFDAWVAKYDADGHLLWNRFVFDQLSYELEIAYGVAADANGDVVVCGYMEFGTYGNDGWIAKYSADGDLRWKRVLGTAGYDRANAVTADGTDVIVAGSAEGALGGPYRGVWDAFLHKYDAAGTLISKRQLGTAELDTAYGVATDESGNVVIAGSTEGSLAGPDRGGSDAFVAKYSVD